MLWRLTKHPAVLRFSAARLLRWGLLMSRLVTALVLLLPFLAHATPSGHKPSGGHKANHRQAGADGQTPQSQRSTVHYRSCAEVRAAGAAPLRSDEPGYSRKLDRDGDGIACERGR